MNEKHLFAADIVSSLVEVVGAMGWDEAEEVVRCALLDGEDEVTLERIAKAVDVAVRLRSFVKGDIPF